MNIPLQIAKHLRETFFGINWTCVNLQEQLKDVSWEEANIKVYELNSIFTLVQHITYYIPAQIKVLQGNPLLASDAESFIVPTINNENEWQQFLAIKYVEAEQLATLIEKLSEEKLYEYFTDEKYGTYYRNLVGMIEHLHYHLGQIVFLKKIINHKCCVQSISATFCFSKYTSLGVL